MEINKQLAKELEVQEWQVDAAVKLIDEGNTIPFISRYRKEATGSLNDEVLRKLFERLTYLRNLEEKKQQVLSVIEEQGKLTPELKKQILAAETLVVMGLTPAGIFVYIVPFLISTVAGSILAFLLITVLEKGGVMRELSSAH